MLKNVYRLSFKIDLITSASVCKLKTVHTNVDPLPSPVWLNNTFKKKAPNTFKSERENPGQDPSK
jgi:hypothetical protein